MLDRGYKEAGLIGIIRCPHLPPGRFQGPYDPVSQSAQRNCPTVPNALKKTVSIVWLWAGRRRRSTAGGRRGRCAHGRPGSAAFTSFCLRTGSLCRCTARAVASDLSVKPPRTSPAATQKPSVQPPPRPWRGSSAGEPVAFGDRSLELGPSARSSLASRRSPVATSRFLSTFLPNTRLGG